MKKIKVFKEVLIIISLCLSFFASSTDLLSSDLLLPDISKTDIEVLKKTLKNGDRGKWARALKNAEKAKDPIVLSITQWRWLTSSDGKASMQQTVNFIDQHSDWPLQTTLQKRVEERMSYNLAPVKVINWFIRSKAISGVGKIKLAEALFDIGANNAATWLIRDSWKTHNFPSKDERRIYKKYKSLFSNEDNNQRIDNLIWQRSWGSSRRQLKRLKKDFVNLYDARIKLARRRPGVDNAIARIPKEQLSDPGLIYERARWRRRAGLNEKALELLLKLPNEIPKPEMWWKEIRFHTRKQLSSGKIKNALHLASNHKQDSAINIAEAEWLAGWMSLRFFKDPRRAYEHFTAMSNTVSMPISTARAAYWAGKAAESLGDATSSKHWFQRSAALTSTFYGQLANHELKKTVTITNNLKIKSIEFKDFTNRNNIKALVALNQSNHYLSRRFALHIAEISRKPKELQNLHKLLGILNRIDLQIAAAKKATQNELYSPTLLFPIPDLKIYSIEIRDERVSLPIALAISRQESLFSFKARSRAGALGIMQLMPRTARLTSKLLKIPYSKSRLTSDPAYNIRLGTHYFGNMLDKYDGATALALAAYNAGPKRVNRWLKQYGDPRKEEIDPVDWVELIPIKETRNYVQRVIEGAQVYSAILPINSPQNINFAADMFFNNKSF